ncbi:MAG TPA: hypothetical protein VFD22_12585 [Gemmatimonadaceae bacterium]|nr:hypothetical protein [Gemmatimonadaceae bacterium]
MKPLFPLSLAMIAIIACTDSTSPTQNLSSSDQKNSGGGTFTVSGSLTNDMFTFDDGTFGTSAGSTFTVESTTGGFGASAPPITGLFNNASNKFIGRLDNHKVNLIVPNGGSAYDISYDLYIIGSWDGNGKQSGKQYGVDIWQNDIACSPTGPAVATLIRTTFSNQKTVQQSFPHNYGEGGGTNKAGEGAFAADALGYASDPTSNTPQFQSFGDTWYKLHFTGLNPCGAGNPIYLQFSVPGATLQSNYDESWGIDNVRIMTDA